jgi:hypothetical protein
MRSRLEASAAGLLDESGITWAYEPECFADGASQYLPDFRLWPSWFLEVKPPSIWEGWPPSEGAALDKALRRMVVIRASIAKAVLMLWLVDTSASGWGRLIVHGPQWAAWECGGAKRWLSIVSRGWEAGWEAGRESARDDEGPF